MRIKSVSIPAVGDNGRVELCLENEGEEEVTSVHEGDVTFTLYIGSGGHLTVKINVRPSLPPIPPKRDSLEHNLPQGRFDS